jgi:hypothetical protein
LSKSLKFYQKKEKRKKKKNKETQPSYDVFVQCTSRDITSNVNQSQISVDMIRRVYDNWRKRLKLINLSKGCHIENVKDIHNRSIKL